MRFRHAVPLLVLAGLVLALDLAAWRLTPSQPPPPSAFETDGPTEKEPSAQEGEPDVLIGTESRPAVVRIAKDKEEAYEAQAERDRDATTQRWTIRLTFGIAVFTAALVWVGWKQRETYQASLAASKAIERAYIYVHQVASFMDYGPDLTPVLRLTVVNSGHTPGWLIEAAAATIPVADISMHLPRPLPVESIAMRPQKNVVFGGQRTEWVSGIGPVEQAEYNNVRAGAWKLVVFGRIKYRDAFGDVHHTDFSFVWDFRTGNSGPSNFAIHPDGYTDAN